MSDRKNPRVFAILRPCAQEVMLATDDAVTCLLTIDEARAIRDALAGALASADVAMIMLRDEPMVQAPETGL